VNSYTCTANPSGVGMSWSCSFCISITQVTEATIGSPHDFNKFSAETTAERNRKSHDSERQTGGAPAPCPETPTQYHSITEDLRNRYPDRAAKGEWAYTTQSQPRRG
jgi:hypothetical protein